MALQGSLKDMGVADLIQVNCQDKKTAQATIISNNYEARIFFHDGAVIHAQLGDLIGEEVIYSILGWDDGEFILDMDISSPQISIKRNWSGLLLEGAKRLDELNAQNQSEVLSSDAVLVQKDDFIKNALQTFLPTLPHLDSIAIVGIDGFVKHIALVNMIDETIFGAVGASAYNLGKRSLGLLRMDNFHRSVTSGETTTIIVLTINKYTLLQLLFSAPVSKISINWDTIDKLVAVLAENL